MRGEMRERRRRTYPRRTFQGRASLEQTCPGRISTGRDCRATLSHVNLSWARLSSTTLSQANLTGANLSHATLEQARLDGVDLSGADLSKSNLSRAYLTGANLSHANLSLAGIAGACLAGADLAGADLSVAKLSRANLCGARLCGAKLTGAELLQVNLSGANLYGVDLSGALLGHADFSEANLTGANLTGADLERAMFVDTNLRGAQLCECRIFATSVWRTNLEGAIQTDLIITEFHEPTITVDNLEVGQFIYLLLHNEKIRDVIDTIGKKAVLILGRFTPERKAVLDRLREELRRRDFLPMLFDFEGPTSRNLTETVSTLAHLARFVVADLTDAKSIPQELQKIVPQLPSVPVQPLLHSSDREWGMFGDLLDYPTVLEPHRYDSVDQLCADLPERVIAPAVQKAEEITARRAARI